MKYIKLTLKILLILALLLFIVIFGIRIWSKTALPDYNENISLKGLIANVEVFRDNYAIPHVYAENEKDLYKAVGYLMAQDRLWQMDLLRRVTLGRVSEIFGEDFIQTDLFLRALQYSEKSEEILKTADKDIIDALEAYADGVNQFIETNKKRLPVEFKILGYQPEPWKPAHSLNLIGYMAWDLKAGWSEYIIEDIRKTVDSAHLAELIPDIGIYKTFVFPKAGENSTSDGNYLTTLEKLNSLNIDILEGSNNWAISGKKSESGKPLLANDMHLGFNVPGVWYQMHQVVKGKLNVTGLILPGQPLIICGHNDSIAWGMTNTYVDNVDFYEEKINPADSSEYLYMDEWKKFKEKKEIINIKGGASVEKNIAFSHRGPVVSGFKGKKDAVITMHWMGHEPSNELRTIFLLNRANNWQDFKDALTSFKSISQNIAFADVNGNIGLYCAAGIPIRKRDIKVGILPGWTDEYDWKSMVPFNELPFVYNPESGMISSANNRTVDSTYPYHISLWYSLPSRIDRIRELLSEKDKLSTEDFKKIQLDQKSKMAEYYMPKIISALENEKQMSPLEEQSLNLLKNWNYEMSATGPEPTIFEMIYHKLLEGIFKDELGELYDNFNGIGNIGKIALYRIWQTDYSVWIDDVSTEKTESKQEIITNAFKNTVLKLEKDYGNDIKKWNWGDIHNVTFAHPLSKIKILDIVFKLNKGPYSVGGSFHTVSPYSYPNKNFGVVDHGSSHRNIFSAGNWDESQTIIPTGNSGIPLSTNYCDQTDMYIKGEYHPDFFSREKIEESSAYHMFFLKE